ncbi:FAD binding domain-containing protein [Trametes polyzona]|nr:FAD binding domain-containing protein [Trametes polyzona]
MTESHVDVLIIGAGPAGLMCANALVQAGIFVRIVDKRPVLTLPEHVQAGHADGMHARTLEILQSYGLAERLFREGEQIHRAAFYEPRAGGGIQRVRRAAAFTAPTARYPFACSRHQGGIESIFIDSMREKGLVIDRPTVPTSLELLQDEAQLTDLTKYPVKVTLNRLEGTSSREEIVHAKFVVGADGAHSWVRKTLGIKLEGDQTDHIWGVIDFHPDTDFPDVRNLSILQSSEGSALLIPREKDHLRIYVQLSDADVMDPETGRIDKARTSSEKIIEIARKVLNPYRIAVVGEVEWWTIYIVGQRSAEQYSVHDRVFIAGDACHTHSPKGGQSGMNASVNDTHNLAWKLAYVLRGWAGMSLLRTYEAERLKFAKDLINFDREWAGLFSEEANSRPSEAHMHVMFRKNDEFMSGIGLQYAPSTIVVDQWQACATKLIVGQRMVPHIFLSAADARPVNIHDKLPADTRFKILVFVGDITDEVATGRIRGVAEKLSAPESFLQRYGHGGGDTVFDVLCISASNKDAVDYTDFPQTLRRHWSKIMFDDVDMHGRSGGGGFAAYGIDPQAGAIVIVRPDGHVGLVAPLDRLDVVDAYFASFMLPVQASA